MEIESSIDDITQKLTPEQWLIIKTMVDRHMRRNIFTFSNAELDAGWKFIALITCQMES